MTNVRARTEGDLLSLDVDMVDVVKELHERVEPLRARWEENERYLAETTAIAGRLGEQLEGLREASSRHEADYQAVAAQVREQACRADEANWYLGELRAAHEALQRHHRELVEQLARARNDLEIMRGVVGARQDEIEAERARRQAVEEELSALHRHEERRRAVRTHRAGMVAEVRASDGRLLFYGCPPNISLTGLAFTTDRPVGVASDFVDVTLHIPEVGRPIDAAGRLVWCAAVEGRHQSGCELVDLLPDSRKRLTDVLAKAA